MNQRVQLNVRFLSFYSIYLCVFLTSVMWVPTLEAGTDNSSESVPNLILNDAQNRSVTQLLEGAESLPPAKLAESVVLGYLALKKSIAEKNKYLEAHSHLFLSEAMGKYQYRAFERIHAKAAYRAVLQSNEGAQKPKHNLGPFYFRLGVIAKDSGDFTVSGYYLQNAFSAFESQDLQSKESIIITLLELAKLSLKQAQIQVQLHQESIKQLNSAQEYVDRAMTLAGSEKDKKEIEGHILDLQAKMILQLSAHLPQQTENLQAEMLANAEKMIRESLTRQHSNASYASYQILPIMNDLVTVLRRTGRNVEAMDAVDDILKVTDKLQRVDVDSVLNMVLVAGKLSNKQMIPTLCNIVMNSEESNFAEVASKSSEALALTYSMQSRFRSMICLSLLSTLDINDNEISRTMLDLVLRRKALVSESESSFWDTLHEQSARDLSSVRSKLIQLRNLLSTKVVAGNGEGLWQLIDEIQRGEEILSVEPWWREFQSEAASEEREAIKGYAQSLLDGISTWVAVSEQKHQFEDKRINIELVEKSIPNDAVLIDFAKLDEFNFEREIFSGKSHYWAFILHNTGKVIPIKLGIANDIDEKFNKNLEILLTSDRLDVEPQLNAMSALYDLIWAPIVGFLGKNEKIIISPDSTLALLPFSALLDPGGKFLIENYTLYLIASGRELVADRKAQSAKLTSSTIIADADFDAAPGSEIKIPNSQRLVASKLIKPLERLESTIEEAKYVREVLGKDVTYLENINATETNASKAKSPHVLHLATHGLFLKEIHHPEQSLNVEDEAALESAYVQHVQSLSLSGLALSGFNKGGMGGSDDGLLTAFDVAGMDLRGTELVVMSACDTGLGNLVAGEGVLGLRRAFRIAGAHYVAMSLWQLKDKFAAQQIQDFYTTYSQGKNPVIALRDTQRAHIKWWRKVLNSNAPPAMWGAMTIQGI